MTDGFSSPEAQFSPEEIPLKDRCWRAGVYETGHRELQAGCSGYHLHGAFCRNCSTEIPQHFFLSMWWIACPVKVGDEWGQPLWWHCCFAAPARNPLLLPQPSPAPWPCLTRSPWPVITCLHFRECFKEVLDARLQTGQFFFCMAREVHFTAAFTRLSLYTGSSCSPSDIQKLIQCKIPSSVKKKCLSLVQRKGVLLWYLPDLWVVTGAHQYSCGAVREFFGCSSINSSIFGWKDRLQNDRTVLFGRDL